MTQHINLRLMGLVALSAAFAAPIAFAQSTTPTTDAAAAPATQSDGEPAKKTWDDLDTNKDGNLTKTEAATIPSLQAVFDQADANADGALSGEEYKTYLAMNGDGNSTSSKPTK